MRLKDRNTYLKERVVSLEENIFNLRKARVQLEQKLIEKDNRVMTERRLTEKNLKTLLSQKDAALAKLKEE